jgi:Flp pilus assembly pilin Flp
MKLPPNGWANLALCGCDPSALRFRTESSVHAPGGVIREERDGMLLEYISARARRENGQALVEYALIISLVAVFLIGGLTFIRGEISDVVFTTIGSAL